MINHKVINKKIVKKLLENSDKLLFIIDKESKILDYNKSFEKYCSEYKYLNELLTYTHIEGFNKEINSLSFKNPIKKFITNFSFDKNDVEDIPSTYEVILYLNENDTITVIAEPKLPLSHDDAKVYLSLINDFSKTSRELTKTKSKLQKLNKNLENEISKAVEEIREKDKILLKQARDAAMGEMIDSIAHQWKGPLGIIKLLAESIRMEYEIFDEPNKNQIVEDTKKMENQVLHLLETLDEFRGFFRPNVELEVIPLYSLIQSVNILLKDELIRYNIEVEIKGDENCSVEIIPNQFKHVLINLVSNSKDAFIENSTKNRTIVYNVESKDNNVILKVSDNAGGIPKEIIENIFDANFTTKGIGKGTGIGLYMTKKIVNKFYGKIRAYNHDDGTCFEIILPSI